MYVTLYDVVDVRNDKHYSVVIVSTKNARFFKPIGDDAE